MVSLRQGLADAARLPFDRLSLESWSEVLGSLVSDVVLDERGEPALRWQRGM
jgi:hypothetical protein